ncbi:MAG: DNA starvation/stationary phase protection protein Dps [Rhodospirillales bacterium]|nr:DNA starvation/stationary phase protection protein Dps [Rhodospirillales bacterium]
MHPTKNDLADNTRSAAITLMQARLADAIDLMTQTKQAHWNVKGANFIALHELFDRIHGEMDDHVDTIAERLVALGGQAYGTVRSAAKHSTLPEYPLDITDGPAHVDALSTALAAFSKSVRVAIDDAAEFGDQDTSDVFTGISRAIDKALWFVESHRA